jgi:protoheme IX farnesyltransferase
MLGWVAATGDFGIEAGTLFLIQFFGNLIFGQLVGSCMKIMKRQVFLCCQQAKDKGTVCRLFLYDGWHYSVITPLGYWWLFIYPVAAVVIFYWVLMLFYAVKLYKLRTAKAAKALMLVSVGILPYYS